MITMSRFKFIWSSGFAFRPRRWWYWIHPYVIKGVKSYLAFKYNSTDFTEIVVRLFYWSIGVSWGIETRFKVIDADHNPYHFKDDKTCYGCCPSQYHGCLPGVHEGCGGLVHREDKDECPLCSGMLYIEMCDRCDYRYDSDEEHGTGSCDR